MVHGLEALIRQVDRRTEAELNAEDLSSGSRPVWRGIAFYGIVHSLTHIVQALVRSGNGEAAVRLQSKMTPPLLAINESDSWQAMVAYNFGRAFALAGKRAEATEQVNAAIEKHPDAAKWAAGEPDMESIRNDIPAS